MRSNDALSAIINSSTCVGPYETGNNRIVTRFRLGGRHGHVPQCLTLKIEPKRLLRGGGQFFSLALYFCSIDCVLWSPSRKSFATSPLGITMLARANQLNIPSPGHAFYWFRTFQFQHLFLQCFSRSAGRQFPDSVCHNGVFSLMTQRWIQDLPRGPWRASGARAYNGSVGAELPSGVQRRRRAPGGGQVKLKAFRPVLYKKGQKVKHLNENSLTYLRQTASRSRNQRPMGRPHLLTTHPLESATVFTACLSTVVVHV